MYTVINFPTKKALKQAVADWNQAISANTISILGPVCVYQPGPFGDNEPTEGEVCLEGPHYPKPHSWYATATLKNGVVVKVR